MYFFITKHKHFVQKFCNKKCGHRIILSFSYLGGRQLKDNGKCVQNKFKNKTNQKRITQEEKIGAIYEMPKVLMIKYKRYPFKI